MDALLTLTEALADVALGPLNLKKDDRTRQRLADLLCSIGDCVSAIGDSIAHGEHATEKCAELDLYVIHFRDLLKGESDEQTAAQLTFWLNHLEVVPGFAAQDIGSRLITEIKPSWTKHGRLAQSQEVREIAGIVRALGNFVRVQSS
jgi:hypothetical protein